MSNLSQNLEDRLCISSVLRLTSERNESGYRNKLRDAFAYWGTFVL